MRSALDKPGGLGEPRALQSPEPSKGPLASRPSVLKAPVWSDRGAEARRSPEGAPHCPHLPSEPRASGHGESGQDGRPLETEAAAGGGAV